MSSWYYQLKGQKKEKHESISKSKEFNGKALTNTLRSTILSLLTPLTLKSGSTTLQFAPIGDIDNVPIEWKTIIVFNLIILPYQCSEKYFYAVNSKLYNFEINV